MAPAVGAAWLGRKLLGPLLADIAEGWRERHEEFRCRNPERILEKAARKAGDHLQEDGAVPPRVAAHMFEDGAWCDDNLMAEYLAGVIAASRSADGRDDRGATWAGLVTRLSAFEVATHYLLYSSARPLLLDDLDLNPSNGPQLNARMPIYMSAIEYTGAMDLDLDDESSDIVGHSLRGLKREELIADTWGSGAPEVLNSISDVFGRQIPETGLVFGLTATGIELYLWAHGKRSNLASFLNPDEVFTIDPPMAIPTACLVRDLPLV